MQYANSLFMHLCVHGNVFTVRKAVLLYGPRTMPLREASFSVWMYRYVSVFFSTGAIGRRRINGAPSRLCENYSLLWKRQWGSLCIIRRGPEVERPFGGREFRNIVAFGYGRKRLVLLLLRAHRIQHHIYQTRSVIDYVCTLLTFLALRYESIHSSIFIFFFLLSFQDKPRSIFPLDLHTDSMPFSIWRRRFEKVVAWRNAIFSRSIVDDGRNNNEKV